MKQDFIKLFVDQTLKDAGLASLPEDFRAQYSKKMAEEVVVRIGLMALNELSKKDLDAFNKKTAAKEMEPKKMYKYFNKKIKKFDDKVTKVLKDFATEFVNGVKNIKIAT